MKEILGRTLWKKTEVFHVLGRAGISEKERKQNHKTKCVIPAKAGVHEAEEYARDSDFQERIKNKQGSIYFVYQVIIILTRREKTYFFLIKNQVFLFTSHFLAFILH